MTDPTTDRLWFAASGCATGFLWSILAGEADLSEAEGWGRAFLGCIGSAANVTTIHWITDEFSHDKDLANIMAGSWMGIQSLASLTNWIGHQKGWEREVAFNAIAIPLNYASAPATSTLGLLWALIGETVNGFEGKVGAFGGMLVFDHDLCLASFTTGAIGHCYKTSHLQTSKHEQGHQVQYAIMGDFGTNGIFLTDSVLGTIFTAHETLGAYIFLFGPGAYTLEPWANDYEKTFHLEDLNKFPIKEQSKSLRELKQ